MEGGGRQVIDDQGRVFGLINVIDVLAVLLVIALVVGGAAFLQFSPIGDDPDKQDETRYVTLDLGDQPSYVLTQISASDDYQPEGTSDTLNVTDVARYTTWNQDGERTQGILVRAAVSGSLLEDESTFEFDEQPLRVNRSLQLEATGYEVEGTVAAVDDTGEELATTETPFLLEATLSQATTADLETGDELQVGGIDATVEELTVYASGETTQRTVFLGLTGTTYDDIVADDPTIRSGVTVPVELQETTFSGNVVRRGTLEEPGTPATRTISLDLENVKPSVADALEAGMTETLRDHTTADIQSVSSDPATVYVETADGELVQTTHPTNMDVELTVDLSVRVLDDGTILFRGDPLRNGDTISLELADLIISGEVRDLER